MPNIILNLSRVALLCFLILVGTIAGVPDEPGRSEQPAVSPTEPAEPTEEETLTDTTPTELEPVSATEAPTAQETEPTEPAYTQEDLDLLALVIYQEAGADFCTDETRMMVGSVVMNRVEDDRFPETIHGVVTQKGQYGRLHWTGPVWPTRARHSTESHAVARAYTIAERILQGERTLPADVIFQSEYILGEIVTVSDGFYFCR